MSRTTSHSLLMRLRHPGDQQAWNRFTSLYTPLLYSWTRRAGLQPDDCADVVQEVLTLLVQKLPQFQYDGTKSFHRWLRTLTNNKCRDFYRRRAVRPGQACAEMLAEVSQTDACAGEAEYRQHLVTRALALMQQEFQPITWQACHEYLILGHPPAEVAVRLGVSVDVIYSAKSRVLRRLRQELENLLD